MTAAEHHTVFESYGLEGGHFDTNRVAKSLGLSTRQMAEILGCATRELHTNSEELQTRLGKLVGLMIRFMNELDGRMDNVRLWLHAPHPDLGGVSPYKAMKRGNFEAVETLIAAMEEGTPL